MLPKETGKLPLRKENRTCTGKNSSLKIMRALLRKPIAVSVFCPMLALSLWDSQAGARCYAQTQTQTQPNDPPKVAARHELLAGDTSAPNRTAPAAARPPVKPDPEISLDIAKELAAMKARIEQLEAELKDRAATTQSGLGQPAVATAVPAKSETIPAGASRSPAVLVGQAPADSTFRQIKQPSFSERTPVPGRKGF
jgi:hypothetical protein